MAEHARLGVEPVAVELSRMPGAEPVRFNAEPVEEYRDVAEPVAGTSLEAEPFAT